MLTQFEVATLRSNGLFWPQRALKAWCFFTGSRWTLDRLCVGRQFIRQEKPWSVYLMLDCLARKRRYACCCCKELLVLGFVRCWQLVHTPHFWHPLVLFSFFRTTPLGRLTLCVDYWVRFISPPPPHFFYILFFLFLLIYMSTWQGLRSVRHPNFVGLSSIPFLCYCALNL